MIALFIHYIKVQILSILRNSEAHAPLSFSHNATWSLPFQNMSNYEMFLINIWSAINWMKWLVISLEISLKSDVEMHPVALAQHKDTERAETMRLQQEIPWWFSTSQRSIMCHLQKIIEIHWTPSPPERTWQTALSISQGKTSNVIRAFFSAFLFWLWTKNIIIKDKKLL